MGSLAAGASQPDHLPRAGQGVVLRRLCVADLPVFLAYRSDPEVGRYQSWSPMSERQATEFLREMSGVTVPCPGEWVQIAIAAPGDQRLIGDIGIFVREDETAAEIGFTLSRDAQGRGLATAAVREVVALLFEFGSIRRIEAVTDARNTPSIRLLERLRFQRAASAPAIFRGEPCVEHTYVVVRSDGQQPG